MIVRTEIKIRIETCPCIVLFLFLYLFDLFLNIVFKIYFILFICKYFLSLCCSTLLGINTNVS